jgi:hypothetical protein
VAGSKFPAYAFAPFHGCLMPVRSEGSTYRVLRRTPPRIVTFKPVAPADHEPPHRFAAFSPRRDGKGFPCQCILQDRRAQPITDTGKPTLVSSPIFLSSPTAFLLIGMPSDHRSGSATVYQACCSIKPLGTIYIMLLSGLDCQRKSAFLTGLNYVCF